MVFVETSALVALVFREPGYSELVTRIGKEPKVFVAAPNLAEALLVVERRSGRESVKSLERLVERLGAEVVSFDEKQAQIAHQAFQTYGKGRHRAALNFGDCLSYGAAKAYGARLIYVGEDFAETDLA